MAGAFSAALDQLEKLRAAKPFDPWAVRGAFYDVSKSYSPGVPAQQLRRMIAHCFDMLGIGEGPAPVIGDKEYRNSLLSAVNTCLKTLFVDQGGRNRPYIKHGVDRRLALGPELWSGGPEEPVPFPNIPLDPDEAYALIKPFLDHLEAQWADDPMAHIYLCWEVFEFPAPPFDTVFERWLGAVDKRRGTDDLTAIRRAMALKTLANEGRQRLGWKSCELYLLPQLSDPHPLVAAAAGKFLGMLYDPHEEMINNGTPAPLTDILEMIAKMPRNRRAVAGGFVYGLTEGSIADMRALPELADFDLDQWVLDILAERLHEPYLPSAQSFWFHVHEGYCFDPAFVVRMMDEGHIWEAYMTATEMHQRVEGMEPVLARLVACDHGDISASAQRWLDLHYTKKES